MHKEAYGNMVSSNNITDAINYIFPDVRFRIKMYFCLRTVHLHPNIPAWEEFKGH